MATCRRTKSLVRILRGPQDLRPKTCTQNSSKNLFCHSPGHLQGPQALSGPDGSRHSSDQHPKVVNSENSNYCPEFASGNFCPPEGKLPRYGISVFLQYLNFCPAYPGIRRGRSTQARIPPKLLRKLPGKLGVVGGVLRKLPGRVPLL